MRFHYLFLALATVGAATAAAQGFGRSNGERPAQAVQATCSPGDHRLTSVSPSYIEVRSGSSSRSVDLADIASIDMTGPVNRNNRFAWATVKTTNGEEHQVGIVLPTSDRTLVLDGLSPQGKPDSIDVLTCNRIVFKTGTT